MNLGQCGGASAPVERRCRKVAAFVAASAVVVGSCGGGSDPESADRSRQVEVPDAGDLIADPEGAAAEMADSLEQMQNREGGGTATLVVGDQTWTFDSVLCAFGEEQIGQEGAVFNLSSIQEGMQMYASIDGFGDSVSLNDIEDFENPSVDLNAFGDDFLVLDGKSVSGETDFIDGTSDDYTPIHGSFEGTCP